MNSDLRTSQNCEVDLPARDPHPEAKPGALLKGSIVLIGVLLLAVPGVFLTHAAQASRRLIVNGYSGELAVVEFDGHSYVAIEALARLFHGSLTIQDDRMILSIPVSAGSISAPAAAATEPAASGFSKDFLKAGIEEISDIREWRTALTSAVQRGFPITEDWLNTYRGRARQSLAATSLAISTDSDRKAFQLLTNVLNHMQQLSDRFVQARKSMTYIAPDALNNDPLDQRILKCARALASMSASNRFTDDASCH